MNSKFNEVFWENYGPLIDKYNKLDTKTLNRYGLQLYWLASGHFYIAGLLARSYDADERYLFAIRMEAVGAIETLFKYIENATPGYEVLISQKDDI